MFESIRGTLKEKEPLKAIVEVGGISYRLSIPLNTFSRLPALNDLVYLFLSQVIREDAHTLYAFLSREERDLFETLITISGIGPKTAIAIIGHIDIQTLHNAVSTEDIRLLSKVPGIGKKTAERLVIEMRDKFKNMHKKERGVPSSIMEGDTLIADAISALMNLGYHPMEAQKAVRAAHADAGSSDLGSLITFALKKI